MKKLLILSLFLTACSQNGYISANKDEKNVPIETDVVSSKITLKEDETFFGSFHRYILTKDISFSIEENPTHGTLTKTADGNFTYVPAQDFNGADKFTFKTTSGSVKTVDIEVLAVNDAPKLSNATASVMEGLSTSVSLSVVDPDSTVFNCSAMSSPSHSSVLFTGSTVNVLGLSAGVDQLYIKCNDGSLDSNVSVLSVTVTAAPLSIANWSFDVSKNLSYSSTLQGSLSDTHAVIVNQPAHGSLSLTGSSFVYTPSTGYTGQDSFSYRLVRSGVSSNEVQVSIDVLSVGVLPTVSNSSVSTLQNTPVSAVVNSQNASLFTVVEQPSHGSLVLNSTTGSFSYSPALNYRGSDSFKFVAGNSLGQSSVGEVLINVIPENQRPVLVGGSFNVLEDTAYSSILMGTDVDGDTLSYSVVTAPSHGTLILSGNQWTYTPNLNYNGSDSFILKANDGVLDSLSSTYNLMVQGTNDAPVASDGSHSTDEETPLTANLVAADVDSTTLQYQIITAPTKGKVFLTNSKTGAFLYIPNNNATGADSFTFKANDGLLDSNIATISININDINDAPVANNQSITTPEDTPVNITLTGSDLDGDALTYTIVSSPSHGSISGTLPNLVYTPNANYNGPDSFTFRVNDGSVDSTLATVSITVTPVNDAPVASNQSVTTPEDTPVNVSLVASDIDGDALSYIIVTAPTHGTLSGSGANLVYTPNANYHGPDSFTFKANDGSLDSNVATVSISVTSVNDAPVASNQSVTTPEDTPVDISLVATDSDGDVLSYSLVTAPAHGTITISGSVFRYTPNANYNGSDSFTFKANDGTVDSNIGTVSITVTPVNDAPVASNQSVTTPEDTSVAITLVATDVDGDSLTYTVVTPPAHGTLSGTGANLTYTPNANYNGPDSFTFRANDGTANSNVATVSINVTSVNDAPVASNQSVSTPEDTPRVITVVATDADGDSLTYTIVSGPTNGTISGTGPNFTYTPNANYNGSDSFTFRANDGSLNSNVATVSITVTPVNDAPVANNQSVTTPEDTPRAITLVGTDVDGDSLTYSIVSGPANGTLSGSGANRTYTPNANFNGTDTFTFRVNDGTVNSNVATVTITVTPVNDAPVSFAQSITTPEDTARSGTLVATDVDGDALTYSIVSGATNGTVVITNAATGAFTYTPNANYNGSDSFTFRANDGTLNSNVSTVSITVTPVNDAPMAFNDSITTNEDTPVAVVLTGFDIEGSALTYSIVSGPSNGTLSGTMPNLTYTPNTNYNGSDSFTYRVNDGSLNSNVATVSITVVPVNDAPTWVTPTSITLNTNMNTPVSYTFQATDVDGDAITYSQGACSGGTCSLNSTTGVFTFTPNNNYTGTVGFSFECKDSKNASCSPNAFLTINILNPNVAPVAQASSVQVLVRSASTTIPLTATDADGNSLTYSIVSGPANGTLSGSGASRNYSAPTWTYCANEGSTCSFSGTRLVKYGTAAKFLVFKATSSISCSSAAMSDPDPGASKQCWTLPLSDSFTFKANDGTVDSNVATVTLNFADWYNASWSNRTKLVFNTPNESEILTDFPVMVKLDSSKIDYSKTKAAGADIRFVGSGGEVLSYEIEQWNPSGVSIIWVKTSISISGNKNHYIHMYYGNPSATDAQNRTDVWSNGYVAVYHMTQPTGPMLDSTANGNDAAVSGTFTRNSTGPTGGNAYSNSSSSACFTVAHNSSQLFSRVTLEGLVRSTTDSQTGILVEKNVRQSSTDYTAYSLTNNGGKIQETITDNSFNSTTYETPSKYFTVNSWVNIGITYNDPTNTTVIYNNGRVNLSNSSATRGMFTTNANGHTLKLLGDCSSRGFRGSVDELRISNVDRSEEWMASQYLSLNDGIIMFSNEENVSSPKISYLAQLRIMANADDGGNILGISDFNSSGQQGTGTLWPGEERGMDSWSWHRFAVPVGIPSSGVTNAKINGNGISLRRTILE